MKTILPNEHVCSFIPYLWDVRCSRDTNLLKKYLFPLQIPHPDLIELREFKFDPESPIGFSDDLLGRWDFSGDGFESITVPLPNKYERELFAVYAESDIVNYCFDCKNGQIWFDHITCSCTLHSWRLFASYHYQVKEIISDCFDIKDSASRKKEITINKNNVLLPSVLAKYKIGL